MSSDESENREISFMELCSGFQLSVPFGSLTTVNVLLHLLIDVFPLFLLT